MKAYYKDGVCYLNDQPTPETSVWAALKAEYVKRLLSAPSQ
jgi:hypothetical protein